MAPDVIEQHLAFGLGKALGGGREISFSLMRALTKDIQGPSTLEAPGFQDITFTMNPWELDVSFALGIKR